MGGGDSRLSLQLKRLLIPGHRRHLGIGIQLCPSVIDYRLPVLGQQGNIYNIPTGIHYGSEHRRNPLPQLPGAFFAQIFREQIIPHVCIAGYDIGNIFHMIDIGINIIVHLANQLGGILPGILQDRILRIL